MTNQIMTKREVKPLRLTFSMSSEFGGHHFFGPDDEIFGSIRSSRNANLRLSVRLSGEKCSRQGDNNREGERILTA